MSRTERKLPYWLSEKEAEEIGFYKWAEKRNYHPRKGKRARLPFWQNRADRRAAKALAQEGKEKLEQHRHSGQWMES